jgi:hypothetical protein
MRRQFLIDLNLRRVKNASHWQDIAASSDTILFAQELTNQTGNDE